MPQTLLLKHHRAGLGTSSLRAGASFLRLTVLVGTPFIVVARNTVAAAGRAKESGITGSLTYAGGPASGRHGNEPGELTVYAADGSEAGNASWQEGQGFLCAIGRRYLSRCGIEWGRSLP